MYKFDCICGIHPGAQVAAWDVTGANIPYPLYTLLSRAQMDQMDGSPGKKLGELTDAERARVEAHAQMICEKHS